MSMMQLRHPALIGFCDYECSDTAAGEFPITLLNKKMSTFISTINVMADGIFVINADGIIEAINPVAAKFFDESQEALVGQRWLKYLHDRYCEHYQYVFLNWKDNKNMPLNHGPKEVLISRADGSWLEVDLSLSCLPKSLTGDKPLFVGVVHNLTKHKAEYSELRRQASTDHLTGLANRYNLEKTLNKSWNESVMDSHPISLILIDVDYFKQFNDQFGHVNGDKCLQEIAKLIDACLPARHCMAARYGGEEFAVILPKITLEAAERVAKHIQKEINGLNFSAFGLPSHFRVSVSQGVVCEQGGQYRTPEALICAADTALYRSKSDGRNRISISP